MKEPILKVVNLATSFFTRKGEITAVRGISFTLYKGEILGIVGESGSGKSVTSKSVMGLIQEPGKIVRGVIELNGEDLRKKSPKEMSKIRGNEIAMIFQDPMTALNPVYTVGHQICEVLSRHQGLSKDEAKRKALELLTRVGIPSPEERFSQYPHEFSGGMRQRVLIAMAMSCNPQVLIADEPTTALDVTIQAQILRLIGQLRAQENHSVLLITHDLGVVAEICDRVLVMYGGLIMEEGTVLEIFTHPSHPYTKGLLNSIPKPEKGVKKRLVPIEGTPDVLLNDPPGCPFANRCPHVMEKCREKRPPFFKISNTQCARCWLHENQGLEVTSS